MTDRAFKRTSSSNLPQPWLPICSSAILALVVFAQSLHAQQEASTEEIPVGEVRNLAIAKLGTLYGEMAAMNQILLSDMKVVADAKDVPGVRTVFDRRDREYAPLAANLIQAAKRVPDVDLARDAALLILNTTYQDERAEAIDLLLTYHVDSSRMREAVTCLGHTSRRLQIIEKVLEKNSDGHVIAHCRLVQADDWISAEASRQRAKEVLSELVQQGRGMPYHRGGVWGPNLEKYTVSDVAKGLLNTVLAKESVAIGNVMPDFKLVDLDRKEVSIADYKGKVTLIVFWATWCGPCLKLTELEKKLMDRYEGYPFDILGVCGDEEITDEVRDIAKAHGMNWTSVNDKLPDGSLLSDAVGLDHWPYLLLLDRNGIIAEDKLQGGITNRPDVQELEFRKAIEKLLPEYPSELDLPK